jgi:hypothetical protein
MLFGFCTNPPFAQRLILLHPGFLDLYLVVVCPKVRPFCTRKYAISSAKVRFFVPEGTLALNPFHWLMWKEAVPESTLSGLTRSKPETLLHCQAFRSRA